MTSNSSRSAARWAAAATTVAAAFSLLTAVPGTAHAAEAASCTPTGPTYAVNTAGSLLRYDMPTPLAGGDLANPKTIDSGWSAYGRVLAGHRAKFYGIKSDGLYLSQRDSSTGTWNIHHKKISDDYGWLAGSADRNQISVDRSDHLWVLDNAGNLRANKYDPATGTWDATSGKIIDKGWDRYNLIVAGDDGVVFGRLAATGELVRSRYDFTSQRWVERHVVKSWADWNVYKSVTSIGGDTLVGVTTGGTAHYYRLDENTGGFAVYKKTVGASGWQNFPNVTGAPDACRILNDHTPAAPSVPLESYSRAAVVQSAAGSLELAYTDNIGRLVHGRIADPSDINGVQWTTISGNDAFAGTPSLAGHTDGRVVVTGHNTSGSVWQRNQTAKSSADWGNWIDLAGAMAQHPVTARTPAGLLVQVAADADGRPWYRIQQRANVDFMGWTKLAGTGFQGPLTAVTVRDGIQLFGKAADGTLSTALLGEDGSLSSWTSLGAQAVTGTPSVVVYPGYRLRVFATDGLGKVVTTVQAAESGPYGAWTTVDGLTADGSPSAVISPLTGLTEITVRGADGYIHNTGETTQGSGTWRAWQQPAYEVSATEPTAFTYTNAAGPTWAYSFRTADNQTRVYQVQQTSALSTMRAQDEKPAFAGTALTAPAK
ncbi:tachylectin-related carbohydrate-binding protein [Streptomyces sp. NPDC003023]|uniref:tachylectin-related carbohydrate-binding protein n=1 Tax=Streptomyces sp. NPDC003023 TaxID=3364675 RepID=UPI00368554F3